MLYSICARQENATSHDILSYHRRAAQPTRLSKSPQGVDQIPKFGDPMHLVRIFSLVIVGALVAMFATAPVFAQTSGKQPNIIMIMGDDIGWSNIGAYNQGIMAMRTPNLDRLAAAFLLQHLPTSPATRHGK